MSTKHTPGPWSWDDEVWTDYDPAERAPWLVDANGNLILTGVIRCKSEQDARLIAAAPELLEALILLEQEMILSGNAGSADYGWKPAIEKTRAAIAKATGEQT